MSKLLHISDDLALPLNIVTMRTAIYGTSGAGKTTFSRLLAEKVYAAKQRFCAIDLKNDWWGLKSSADLKSSGLPIVIFGGPKRDVQIYADGGATVADTIVAIEQSVIVDLDDFSKRKQLQFLTAFLERLYDVNRKPLMLFADESDRYAPQKAMSPEANVALGASEDICRRGRKRGIGSIWLTQRTAVLNKNVSDICDLTIVFRTPGSRDLKDLEERVGRVASKEEVANVMKLAPGLEDGQAIFLSSNPKLREYMPAGAVPLQLPLPWTFDSSSTPSVGQRRREPKMLAKVDLAQIEQQMAEQVERAKSEDPAALRKKVGELQATIRTQQQVIDKQVKAEQKPVDVPVLKDSQLKRLEKLLDFAALNEGFEKRLAAALDPIGARMVQVDSLMQAILQGINKVRNVPPQTAHLDPREHALRNIPKTPAPITLPPAQRRDHGHPRGSNSADSDNGTLPPRRQRILNALLFFESLGYGDAAREQIAFFCETSPSSSTYEKDCGAMRSGGLIAYPTAGRVQLTEDGRKCALPTNDVASLSDYHNKIARILPPRREKIMRALVDAHPHQLTREDLATRAGTSVASSTFEKDLGGMRTSCLLDYPGPGLVRASDLLFPTGLV